MLPLYTTRLLLRKFTRDDIQPFVAYRNDPEVARYQSWDSYSPTEAEQFIDTLQRHKPGPSGQWYQIAIALKNSGTLIGDCAFKIQEDNPRQAVIGVTFSQSFQGQGFAVEALSCLLDYLFAQMKLHRVVADTDPRNIAAWTLLERLGMRREGHLQKSLWFKGDWADEYLYAILQEEWFTRQSHLSP